MKTSAGQTGFTVLELLVTITIGSILLAIAVPSFSTIIQNNRRSSYVNEFVRALNFARGEAVTLRKKVTMCRSADPTASAPACSATTANNGWQDGWVIYADRDEDDVIDAGEVLAVHEAIPAAQTSLCGNGPVASEISFRKTGLSSNAGTVTYCDARGVGTCGNDSNGVTDNCGRAVVINPQGRIRTTPDISTCSRTVAGNIASCS